jgi:hypothetical protein
MNPRCSARIQYRACGTTGTLPSYSLLAARSNVEPEEVQARRSETRRSLSRRVSAAFNATVINTYSAIGICVSCVLVLQCGQIADADTGANRPPGEDVCCASEPTPPTPCAPTTLKHDRSLRWELAWLQGWSEYGSCCSSQLKRSQRHDNLSGAFNMIIPRYAEACTRSLDPIGDDLIDLRLFSNLVFVTFVADFCFFAVEL